jgi:hypothetical protein
MQSMGLPRLADSFPDLFLNARGTFQRIKDAKIGHGWIVNINDSSFTVRIKFGLEVAVGEEFAFTLYGLGKNLHCFARLRELIGCQTEEGGSIGTFLIYGERRLVKGDDNARLCDQNVSVEISVDGCPITMAPVATADICRSGFGLFLPTAIEKDAIAEVTLITPEDRVIVQAKLMNTRNMGFSIVEIGRLDLARWSRIFERGR